MDSRQFLASSEVNVNNNSYTGVLSKNISGSIQLSDNFTKSTYDFNDPSRLLQTVTLENLLKENNNVYTDDEGRLVFTDGTNIVYLKDLVSHIKGNNLGALNTLGSIYDFQFKKVTFGNYKYCNAKFCTDVSNSFGYFSIDKLINDERSRQLYQTELYNLYVGTDKEALYPPYSGFLIDQNYQIDGWISIDYLIHLAMGNNFAYDDTHSFSLRTKPITETKRLIFVMLLTYMADIFSLRSYNKLSDFGIRIVDRNTNQVLDISHIKTNQLQSISNNVTCSYVGDLSNSFTTLYDPTVPHPIKNNTYNDKKYTNICNNQLITLSEQEKSLDVDAKDCYKHELSLDVRLNPYADIRINKQDIQNTIDPIHWTRGLITQTCSTSANILSESLNINYDKFKDLVGEFGKDSYIVGNLNESRSFANGDGSFTDGIIIGGFSHDAGFDASQRKSTERWNGTSWCVIDGDLSIAKSLGIYSGNSTQGVYSFGASVTYASTPNDVFNKDFLANNASLHAENDTEIFNGISWYTPSSYTAPVPNIARHSACGKLDIKIQDVDENGNPYATLNPFKVQSIFKDNFIMHDNDFIKLKSQQSIDGTTKKFNITRYCGIAFGGCTDSTLSLFTIPESNVINSFEYVGWGNLIKSTANVTGSTIYQNSTETGSWLVDPTRNYPIKAYGICYVGTYLSGLATGGKTGNGIDTLNKIYNNQEFNEFDNIVSNFSYEYNGTSWTRRDNMYEQLYYHVGVGNEQHSIFWGGMHPSLEEPHIYDTTETFEDWEVVINRFGGSTHPYGTFGIDGELRYNLFSTLLEDSNNTWRQLEDSRDYVSSQKPLYCTTVTGGLYSDFNSSSVNSILGNSHNIEIIRDSGNYLLKTTTYYGGESVLGKRIIAGNSNEFANDSNITIGQFSRNIQDDIFNKYYQNFLKDTSGNYSNIFVPNSVLAPKYNTKASLLPDYAGHTVDGGMWLWSRPSIGEHLFNPENFLKPTGTDITDPEFEKEYISHSFNPYVFGASAVKELFNFYATSVSGNIEGIEQIVSSDDVIKNKLSYTENWNIQNDYYNTVTLSGFRLKINESIINALDIGINKSSSYGIFNMPLDKFKMVNVSGSELDSFIKMQFDSDLTNSEENSFIYDISPFISWTLNTSGKDFVPITYDSFNSYFNKSNGDLFTSSCTRNGSSIRDRASLFPWCDLLNGDSGNKAKKGDITWNWVKDYTNNKTCVILAETTFADYVSGVYETLKYKNIVIDNPVWVERFKISKLDLYGNIIWYYEIEYIENFTYTVGDKYYLKSDLTKIGTLFGTGIKERILNDGLSENESDNVLRTFKLWNRSNFGSNIDSLERNLAEQKTVNYVNWKKLVDNDLDSSLYQNTKGTLFEVINDQYKVPTKCVSVFANTISANGWYLNVPTSGYDGLIIADSKLAISPITSYTSASYGIVGFDSISKYIPDSGESLVKEYISSFKWGNSDKWKITTAYIANKDSNGYISLNYGKSTYDLPPQTVFPISATLDSNFVENIAPYAYPWSYLINDPAMYVELVDISGGFWFAYGDSTNKKIIDENDSQINVYRIGHIPNGKLNNLYNLPLGKTIYQNIENIRLYGSSTSFRHREAIIELVNTQHGEDLFDIFTTIVEKNDDRPFGDTVPYIKNVGITANNIIIPEPTAAQWSPYLYCCVITPPSGDVYVPTSGCVLQLLAYDNIGFINPSSCFNCEIDSNYDDSLLPKWEQHVKETWSVPFIESPFAGIFGNSDFNIWISTAKTNVTNWGTVTFNSIPQTGQLIANFKASRVGIDKDNNKVYYAILTSSIGIDKFDSISSGNKNVPCEVSYDEYIFPTDFNIMSGYASLPFIKNILGTSTSYNKDPGIFCVDPMYVYIPEVSGCGVSANNIFYTEWVTNFVHEFKNYTTVESDPNKRKYYYRHNVDLNKGSSTYSIDPVTNSIDIIGTDWRKYQDNVGIGGNVPDITRKDCLPSKKWYLGQVAFGTPDKAILAGGYEFDSTTFDSSVAGDYSWWHAFTVNDTIKWNKTIITPEDTYNNNYYKRTFSPAYTNNENTFSNSTMGYVMFNVGKDINIYRNGTIEFNGDTNVVNVIFDTQIPDDINNNVGYSIKLSQSSNVKIWWDNKTTTGFSIYVEDSKWIGTVDWSIMLITSYPKEVTDSSLEKYDTYDEFNKL